jgi:hypothetical protein
VFGHYAISTGAIVGAFEEFTFGPWGASEWLA